jgi:energy-coupling factor transport system substrate-specific component
VAISLAVCFWWYERSHPSSKELALVATMAALSALGRDAFAALPDVKPTTTMVLICGYCFGPGPGFAVGAVGALASNIFLGQGSWTPWQMLAWGVVGIGGALLGGLLGHRQLGRLKLAIACAVAAEVFNLLIDLYSWSQGPAHTLSAYGVWVGGALSFDITHVVASFVFGVSFGPALMRMLTRARTRMEITWEPIVNAPAMIVLVLTLAGATLCATSSPTRASTGVNVSRQLSYLLSAQNADGGFGGAPGQSSSELYSAWVAMGLASAGHNPQSVTHNGHSVLDSLRGQASTLQGTGDEERTILALRACGASAYSFDGQNLVSELLRARSSDGSFEHQVNLTAFAIFALRAVGHSASYSVITEAARWIEHQQNSDGGFGFATRGQESDVDDTAAALQSLIDADARNTPLLTRILNYLIRSQNPDGGYPQQPGGESNAQSTAWAAQALIAAGHNPNTVHRDGSRSPIAYLQSLIAPNGSVRYSRTSAQSPVWVTAQALMALDGRALPVVL